MKDPNNNTIVVNNLLSRNYFLPKLIKNFSLFYEYEIKEGDTPENIAYRYYDDIYRYWIVLYSNNILDFQAQWPLTTSEFESYLKDKYKDVGGQSIIAYTLSTVHHYEKLIYTSENTSSKEKLTRINIDEGTYNSLMESSVEKTKSGVTYRMRITKNAVSIYNYEFELNESKRKINLLKKEYSTDAEKQFQDLMVQ
jgi:hypothetical protein